MNMAVNAAEPAADRDSVPRLTRRGGVTPPEPVTDAGRRSQCRRVEKFLSFFKNHVHFFNIYLTTMPDYGINSIRAELLS